VYSIIISLIVGAVIGAITQRDLGTGWGIFCAVGAMLISQIVIGLLIRRKVGKLNLQLQQIMQAAQAKINRQMQQYQMRPPGNMRLAQQNLEKLQSDAVRRTLEATREFEPWYKWNMMLKKQINTMKMQLHFQLKEFGKVDELLPKCFLLDPRSLAIKLVRLYKNNDASIDKFYDRKCKKLKGEDAALVALTYAWIKLRQDEPQKAVAALVAARKLSDNQTLIENCDRLVNGKYKHFNNAGLGDLWYSLYLEEPKIKPQRQVQQRMY
jgi:hypothetical protein